MEELAPMLVAITLILTSGAVFLLRPIAKRLGDLLELMAKQRTGEIEAPKQERMETLLESISSRMALVEERLDFTDSLLSSRRPQPRQLPEPSKEWRE
jgi:hypothetical protein